MGGPKQMLQVGDRYLIDLIVQPLRLIGPPTLIGSGEVPDHLRNLGRVPDIEAAVGPLAGVLGALRSDRSGWLISACDQPWLSSSAVEWLLNQDSGDAAAVMPRDAERIQPFPGIYRPQFADIAYEAGPGAAISALADDPRIHSPSVPEPLTRAWSSVNAPEDLATLLNSRG